MKKIFTVAFILLSLGIISLCNYNNLDNASSKKVLSPKKIFDLNIPEPSGLCFDEKTKTLWTVSDEKSLIYNIDQDGKILNTLSIEGKDLEGITLIGDSIIATVLERKRQVVFLTKKGKELKRFKLDLEGDLNSGLEGITYNENNNHLYVVNEKKPTLLLEINLDGKIISEYKLKIAKDLSGLAYDAEKNQLWILSDENKSIFRCKPDGTVIDKYEVDIKQIEGIAFDFKNSKLFIVSDKTEKLYVFEIP